MRQHFGRQLSPTRGKLEAHTCRCRVHRDTEHRGRNMHATATLVQALRPQENHLPRPPKGPPATLSSVLPCTELCPCFSHLCEVGAFPRTALCQRIWLSTQDQSVSCLNGNSRARSPPAVLVTDRCDHFMGWPAGDGSCGHMWGAVPGPQRCGAEYCEPSSTELNLRTLLKSLPSHPSAGRIALTVIN